MGDFVEKDFAARLELLIELKGWNKTQLAKAGEITGKTMSTYFSGTALPNAKTLANWAATTDVNLNWLLAGKGPMLYSRIEDQEEDPIIRRMQKAKAMLEELRADPETIQKAILNITAGDSGEGNTEFGQDQKRAG
ncbi:helix-turn-helix domain-containing protein [Maridesulfovibrio sp. FT414]|uniref:helix-turn-helix domain-containing protein n=1 Tax=Maridesulfovibrio sp. FT414 TaxID=2979469 RepID=UPI003D808A2A